MKSFTVFELNALRSKARIFNRYCLPLLTFHPSSSFKRENYFPELVAHMPECYHHLIKNMHSSYTETLYLNEIEKSKYQIYIKDGYVVGENLKNTEKNEVVVLTEKGEIFSAKKSRDTNIQHTSFNHGGYLLFAGFWCVENGRIISVEAESGHYEPSVTSLQNFVRFLTYANIDLTQTKFIFVHRSLVKSEISDKQVLSCQYQQLTYSQLIGEKIKFERGLNSLVTSRDLELISEYFFQERKDNILKRSKEDLTVEIQKR